MNPSKSLTRTQTLMLIHAALFRTFEDVDIGCEPGGILMPYSRTTITAEAHVSLQNRHAHGSLTRQLEADQC